MARCFTFSPGGVLKTELLALLSPCPGRWGAGQAPGSEPEGGQAGGRELLYLGLHHVHPPRPQLPDAVVDIHHSFPLGHVQHDVDDNETAGPPRTSAAQREGSVSGGERIPVLLLPLRFLLR